MYEVRSRQGAAWRGAVVLDGSGDPWLVFADKHDRFHSTTAGHFRSAKYEVSAVDLRVRACEDEERALRDHEISILSTLLDGLRQAVHRSPEPARFTVCGYGASADVELRVRWGEPAGEVADMHTATGDVEFIISIAASEGRLRDLLLSSCVPFIQPDPRLREQVYGLDHETLQLVLMVSQADMARLLVSGGGATHDAVPGVLPEPTLRHYVAKDALIGAYIDGEPTRARCGVWFVPVRDGETAVELPICGQCEEVEPVAQRLLDAVRAGFPSE